MDNKGITSVTDIKFINKELVKIYGEKRFRVSWSDSQLEKRFGVYEEHYGKVYLRTVSGVREVPKYPYIKNRWVLEMWCPPELVYDPALPDSSQGSFEPAWTFEHAEGYPLQVSLDIVRAIIYEIEHKPLPGHRTSELKAQERIEFDAEVASNIDHLIEVGSPLKKDGTAII